MAAPPAAFSVAQVSAEMSDRRGPAAERVEFGASFRLPAWHQQERDRPLEPGIEVLPARHRLLEGVDVPRAAAGGAGQAGSGPPVLASGRCGAGQAVCRIRHALDHRGLGRDGECERVVLQVAGAEPGTRPDPEAGGGTGRLFDVAPVEGDAGIGEGREARQAAVRCRVTA
jgi:hypothetical protein